jgi:transcriptional regulator with XRE-family HTH domain
MNFLDKLSNLILERKMNRRTFSQDSGISYTTISNWYSRGYDGLTLTTFRKLCDYFNVTMDSMAYDDREIEYRTDQAPPELSVEDRKIIDAFHKSDFIDQMSVKRTLKVETDKEKEDTGSGSSDVA